MTAKALEELGLTSNHARQFATNATRHRLAVRHDRGKHVAVDPSIAIRSRALPSYDAEVLVPPWEHTVAMKVEAWFDRVGSEQREYLEDLRGSADPRASRIDYHLCENIYKGSRLYDS